MEYIQPNENSGTFKIWNVIKPLHPAGGPEVTERISNGEFWVLTEGNQIIAEESKKLDLWRLDATGTLTREASIELPSEDANWGFLSDKKITIDDGQKSNLFDISNPASPKHKGSIPDSYEQSSSPSGTFMAQGNPVKNGVGNNEGRESLWNISDTRRPNLRQIISNINPITVSWLSNRSLVGMTSDGGAVGIWDIHGMNGKFTRTDILGINGVNTDDPIAYGNNEQILAIPYGAYYANENSIELVKKSPNHNNLEEYASLGNSNIGVGGNVFTPNERMLAENLSIDPYENENGQLMAFVGVPSEGTNVGIVYPTNTDTFYQDLCSVTAKEPVSPSWRQYLPTTYYRPACS